jgi:hypothetical protein
VRGTRRAILNADQINVRYFLTMNADESLETYFREARLDAVRRDHCLAHSRYARKAQWWLASLFGVVAIAPGIYAFLTGGHPEILGVAAAGCIVALLTASRFSERIAVLTSFGEIPNQSKDPAA